MLTREELLKVMEAARNRKPQPSPPMIVSQQTYDLLKKKGLV